MGGMKSIRDILPDFEKKAAAAPKGRKRQTERGELMRFFLRHLNYSRKQDGLVPMTMAHLGTVLEKIPTPGPLLSEKCLQPSEELR